MFYKNKTEENILFITFFTQIAVIFSPHIKYPRSLSVNLSRCHTKQSLIIHTHEYNRASVERDVVEQKIYGYTHNLLTV